MMYGFTMKHRTQILLESWQYERLRARAEKEQCSLSALIRNLLDSALESPPPSPETRQNPLQQLQGIGEDKTGYGRDHDRLLYHPDKPG